MSAIIERILDVVLQAFGALFAATNLLTAFGFLVTFVVMIVGGIWMLAKTLIAGFH